MSGIDVLVLAAFHPELASLRAELSAGAGARVGVESDFEGSVGGVKVAACAVGVGLSAAGVGAALRVVSLAPRAVVLVGTCGAYANRGIAIGDVVVAKSVSLVEPAVCEGRAAFPAPMSLAIASDAEIATELARVDAHAHARARVRHVDVATTLAITADDALASRVAARTGCDAEHLEAHSVATACASRGVPFAACLGVANIVGSGARDEWRVHHQSAADAAIAVVVAWMHRGAPLNRAREREREGEGEGA